MAATATAALAAKEALFDAITNMVDGDDPHVLVSWGHPGQSYPDQVVAMMNTTAEQDIATLGTSRARDETIRLDVQIVVSRGGGDWRAQQRAETDAYALLDRIDYYCRQSDTQLGGAVRHIALERHQCDGFTDDRKRSAGWVAQITATFLAVARITGSR